MKENYVPGGIQITLVPSSQLAFSFTHLFYYKFTYGRVVKPSHLTAWVTQCICTFFHALAHCACGSAPLDCARGSSCAPGSMAAGCPCGSVPVGQNMTIHSQIITVQMSQTLWLLRSFIKLTVQHAYTPK